MVRPVLVFGYLSQRNTSFLFNHFFDLPRGHHYGYTTIYGSSDFTLPILSLLTYERLIKDIHPRR
jgi:hypothetical protein